MLAKNRMLSKHQVISIQSTQSVEDALNLFLDKQIDSVPILTGNKYIGMISQAEIYKRCFYSELPKEEFSKKTNIGELATHQAICVKEDELFESTIHSLKKYPSIAVVDDEKNFIGLVSRFDVIELFQEVMGKDRDGIRISMTCMEKEGQLARILYQLHHYHVNIISLVTFDSKDHLLRRIVMKIEKHYNIDKIIKKLEETGLRIVNIVHEYDKNPYQ